MPSLNKWDQRFYDLAQTISTWSRDPSTKVGAVIVDSGRRIVSTGYNGLPMNILDTQERLNNRVWKLDVIIHAEVNAILNAAKNGSSTEGCTIYTTFSPCSSCSGAIIQAGISKVVCPDPMKQPERWRNNFLLGNLLLEEAGISTHCFRCVIIIIYTF